MLIKADAAPVILTAKAASFFINSENYLLVTYSASAFAFDVARRIPYLSF
jgi:hypothetical protein